MKILHVIATMSPRSGGPYFSVRDMAHYQAQSGLDVSIFTTNADHPSGVLDVPVNVPVYVNGVKHHFFTVQFRPLLVTLPMAQKLIETIKEYDLFHIHGMYRFPSTFTASICRKHKLPYIIRPHGNLDPFLYKQSSRSLIGKRIYERFLDLPNLHAASAIHYTSTEEKVRAGFLNIHSPGFVVEEGLDWSQYEVLPPKGAMRHRLNLRDEPIILFLGRINFKKGLDLLVQAFSKVALQIKNAVLVIAGPENDSYARTVRKLIEQLGIGAKVYWQGMLLGRQVLEAYVDSDVFVLPSYSENFGVAVVEAMACGIPVVISDQVNIWAEVANAEAGLVVKTVSEEIKRAIIAIIENKDLATKMGNAGRRLVKHRYSYERIIKKITTVYESIIEKKYASNHGSSGNGIFL